MIAGMSEMTRRDFGMAAMLAAICGVADGQEAGVGTLGPSKVFPAALTKLPNGTERWNGPSGTLATGEALSFHVSIVPAGTPKVELHVIKHSELLTVAEGTLSFEHDGVVDEVKPGSVIYVAYGTNHRVWNSGTTTARYFVIQIGGDTKKA
jgi:mannose-6-phosphate isomerase-like protein (cupin superfamily)